MWYRQAAALYDSLGMVDRRRESLTRALVMLDHHSQSRVRAGDAQDGLRLISELLKLSEELQDLFEAAKAKLQHDPKNTSD